MSDSSVKRCDCRSISLRVHSTSHGHDKSLEITLPTLSLRTYNAHERCWAEGKLRFLCIYKWVHERSYISTAENDVHFDCSLGLYFRYVFLFLVCVCFFSFSYWVYETLIRRVQGLSEHIKCSMAGARGVLLSILGMQQANNLLAFANFDKIVTFKLLLCP